MVRKLSLEVSHRRKQLVTRHNARFGILGRFDNYHDSHFRVSVWFMLAIYGEIE
jgi:hypothetical protein